MRATIDLSDLHFNFDEEESSQLPPIFIRHISTFEHKLNSVISAICPTSNNVAWVACNSDAVVAQYQKHGREIKRISTSFYVDDMKLTENGHLLVAPDMGNDVKFLNVQSTETINFTKLHPFVTRGLFISKENDLYVSLHKENMAKVIKMNSSGEILRELYKDRANVPLYSDPDKIAVNSHGDVIVLDWATKCIISLDIYGRYRFKYNGKIKKVVHCEVFTPTDIVCDKYDNILICDCDNNAVHMLDRHGQFLCFLVSEENGVTCPCALALDEDGQLWLGEMNGQIHVIQYYSNK
ncbi:uncharacterized protein LOC134278199 [Saccostrea cucullata]|uniref:uncharacterized protein LOC134278199 n=1 Tax=Saccostrea cuccullata TaxID=36930 RepID=UPI002ED05AA2